MHKPFFKSEDKEKSRETPAGRREYRVRQVAVKGTNSAQSVNSTDRSCESKATGSAGEGFARNKRDTKLNDKRPPVCFVCFSLDSRPNNSKHYLAYCKRFMQFSPKEKRQTVLSAGRCLKCLSTENFARDCGFRSKCRSCGPQCKTKHPGALHERYATDTLGAADATTSDVAPQPVQESATNSETSVKVRRVEVADAGTVLLRTSAVRVINQSNGRSTLAYAQHDTASQVTLISEALKDELGLQAVPDPAITVRTLADQTATCLGRTDFTLQSLDNGDKFAIFNAIVVPYFSDDENTLPHGVDVTTLKHFEGVEIPRRAPHCFGRA